MSPVVADFGGLEARHAQDLHWYACFTRARHEKKVESLLQERRVEAYLPIVQRLQQWKDRKKLVSFVLFPSYVLARFPLHQLQTVLSLPGVVTVVQQNGRPAAIRDEEVENVRRFSEVLAASEVEPEVVYLPAAGDRVRIASGPFEGVVGTVVERRGRHRIVVGLEAIGRGLEVDLPSGSLRRAT
jgi:transcription antitermination factor NusG